MEIEIFKKVGTRVSHKVWTDRDHGRSPEEGQHIIDRGGVVPKARRLYDKHKLTFGEESIQRFLIAVESLRILGLAFFAEVAGTGRGGLAKGLLSRDGLRKYSHDVEHLLLKT